MKKITLLKFLATSLIAAGFIETATARTEKTSTADLPTLSQTEISDLKFMREKEKLARDVYLTLYAQWEQKVFYTISLSEQKHTDAILSLLNTYSIPDPALEDVGEFSNDSLQILFDYLITIGRESERAAFEVGVMIEENDIEDLTIAMGYTDHADILKVYGDLLAGSENHLEAFIRQIERVTGEPHKTP